mmetsp:Transcript_25235/g.42570  ORF Transcript_25235/g.42570 Transcript_25235/m.42570 type:complete len:814 (+) Transcript_25235:105-2546(+)
MRSSISAVRKRKTMEEQFDANHHMMGHDEFEQQDPPRPVADSIHEYFEAPGDYLPHPDFIKDNFFVEEDTALILAIRNLNTPAVYGLLAAGINPNAPNQKGVTPISAASHKGDTDIIQMLVDAGASVNAMNSTGSTALIQASHFGHLSAVQLLLRHGGIADFTNSKGTTALMRASQEGYVEIVVILLAAKSEVNRKNNEGMNSLMLASQRGHEKVVLVLVKYGAAMDEQTSQGSTALMLACKRGHERVVEVLVACGAEIYMRDCRARSARDTALRRHHGALLAYLDTQVQVKCLQDTAREERAELLRTMRRASIRNQLQYSPETKQVLAIIQGVDRFECLPDGTDRLIDPDNFHTVVRRVLGSAAPETADVYHSSYSKIITSNPSSSSSRSSPPAYRADWTFPSDVCLANINSPVHSSFIASAPYRARHPLPTPEVMYPHRPGYAPWQWPVLLKRVFDLPLGVHELVIEYLPAPRIWKTCIHRLKRRVTLAPQAATLDIAIMLDEMITDMCIFRPPQQRGHLITLSRNESVMKYLAEQWHMPKNLIKELVVWSDVQSLIARSADCDVTFKANLAKKFLLLAASMYRFLSSHSNLRMLYSLTNTGRTNGGYRSNKSVGFGINRQLSRGSSSSSTSDSNGAHRGSRGSCWGSDGGESGEDQKDMIDERDNHCNEMMDIDFLVDIEDEDADDDNDNDQDEDQDVKVGVVPLSPTAAQLTPLHQQRQLQLQQQRHRQLGLDPLQHRHHLHQQQQQPPYQPFHHEQQQAQRQQFHLQHPQQFSHSPLQLQHGNQSQPAPPVEFFQQFDSDAMNSDDDI